MYIKFDIYNEMLEWYKKRTIFAKRAVENNSNAIAATDIKWKKTKITQHELILTHSLG